MFIRRQIGLLRPRHRSCVDIANRARLATASAATVSAAPAAAATPTPIAVKPTKYLWGEEHEDNLMKLIETPRFKLSFADIAAAKTVVRDKLYALCAAHSAYTHLDRCARVLGTSLFSPTNSTSESDQSCGRIYLKKEHTHYTGSYKERGVVNALSGLTAEQRAKGVVCSSSGNHGLAVSYWATKLGISSVCVFPLTTYNTQVKNSLANGARVVLHGESYRDAYDRALNIAKTEGRTFIPAQNDRLICAGHGTLALDLIEQNPYLDAIVVPASGGSLLTATALAIKHVNPRIRVFGVESSNAPLLHTALNQPKPEYLKPVSSEHYKAPSGTGQLPYEVMKANIDDVLFVTETERAYAILTLMELEKTVVQGSGVAALAAVMSSAAFRSTLAGKQVGVVCTGGNIESSLLARVIDKGLVSDGRMARIRVATEDRPGHFSQLCSMIGRDFRANIRDVYHERAFFQSEDVGYTQAVFALETRGFDHIESILAGLHAAGYTSAQLDTRPLPHAYDQTATATAAVVNVPAKQ